MIYEIDPMTGRESVFDSGGEDPLSTLPVKPLAQRDSAIEGACRSSARLLPQSVRAPGGWPSAGVPACDHVRLADGTRSVTDPRLASLPYSPSRTMSGPLRDRAPGRGVAGLKEIGEGDEQVDDDRRGADPDSRQRESPVFRNVELRPPEDNPTRGEDGR